MPTWTYLSSVQRLNHSPMKTYVKTALIRVTFPAFDATWHIQCIYCTLEHIIVQWNLNIDMTIISILRHFGGLPILRVLCILFRAYFSYDIHMWYVERLQHATNWSVDALQHLPNWSVDTLQHATIWFVDALQHATNWSVDELQHAPNGFSVAQW